MQRQRSGQACAIQEAYNCLRMVQPVASITGPAVRRLTAEQLVGQLAILIKGVVQAMQQERHRLVSRGSQRR